MTIGDDGEEAATTRNGDWYQQKPKNGCCTHREGYDLNYCWGVGTHSNRQGGAMMPEMLCWLWRDYPRPPDDPLNESNRGLLEP